jgi:hypothetical protein
MSAEELGLEVRAGVREILSDSQLRAERVNRMTNLFDGRGAERIVTALCGD